jgi:hypothetical protein
MRSIIHQVESFSTHLTSVIHSPNVQIISLNSTIRTKITAVDLLDPLKDFYMHHHRCSASSTMQIIYGRRIPDCKDQFYLTNGRGQ